MSPAPVTTSPNSTQLILLAGSSVESVTSSADSSPGLGQGHGAGVGGIIDNSVIQGRFTFDKCTDVHVGPKYQHHGNIVINQNISVCESDKGDINDSLGAGGRCRQIVFKDRKQLEEAAKEHVTCLHRITHWIHRHKCLSGVLLLLILIMIGLTLFSIFVVNSSAEKNEGDESHTPSFSNSRELEKEYPKKLKFVLRETWGAALTNEEFGKNPLPVGRVILIHTASGGTCNKFSACKQQVLNIQDYHISIGFGDIGYSFVIGGDGYIYVGRGWDLIGAHTGGFNNNSLGIAFIGDFRTDELNNNIISATKTLLEFGVRDGKLSEHFQLFGHCQILPEFPFSPGKNVMKVVKTWSHWNSTNLNQCKG